MILIRRSQEVQDELWRAISRNIAPNRALVQRSEITVPVGDFLAKKNWLASNLESYDCGVDFEPSVVAILDRERTERAEIAALLSRPFSEISPPRDTTNEGDDRFKRRSLKRFQRRDLAHILSLSHAANFSVPGAGKTAVAYACYEAERLRGRVERLLVIAPLSAFEAWTTEAGRWIEPAPRVTWLEERIPPDCEVLLVNYQRLASRYDDIATWAFSRPCHVILDEAHRIKRGRRGEWGSACLDLAYIAARRDILTGTPAPQHPVDLIALLDFLWPNQAERILPAVALQPNPPADAMAQISRLLRPLFVRTTKDELGLRPPIIRAERVSMKPLQAKVYDAVRARMRRQLTMTPRDHVEFTRIADIVMYLIEAATNPALLARALGGNTSQTTWPPSPIPPESSLVAQVLHYATHEVPRKFEKLAKMVHGNAEKNRKTLVWSNFVDNLEELKRVLAPYNPALIYGAIPSSPRETDFITRQSELRRFRQDGDCKVLLANPAAMAEGVSLHKECHDAIYLDRTFNAGQYLQSVDRIHRLGLKKNIETRITFLLTSGTIDETIDRRVYLKASRLAEMLADHNLVVMALPGDDDYGEWVETNDVDSLFSHLEVARA